MANYTRSQKSRGNRSLSAKRPTNSLPAQTAPVIQPNRDYISHLQRKMGNQAVARLWQSGVLQPRLIQQTKNEKEEAQAILIRRAAKEEEECKLKPLQKAAKEEEEPQMKMTMGAPGDVYEKEADSVAEQVSAFYQPGNIGQGVISRLNVPKVLGLSNKPYSISRVSTSARRSAIFANSEVGAGGEVDHSIENQIMQSKGSGSPLPSSISNVMALRTGHDFGNVRVKTGSQAEHLNAKLGARAFTHGSDIWMGRGESTGDVRLMAHELTHVVQQGAAKRISPQSITGLANMKSSNKVLGALQAMASGRKTDNDIYANEIAQFQNENSPQSIQALQNQILPKSNAVSIGQKSNSKVMRDCSCNPSGGGGTTPLVKKTVTLNVTKMHGSSGNVSSDLTYANTKVYNQANIEIKKGNEVTVDEPTSKTILGNDLILQEFTTGTNPTTEEKDMLKLNQTKGAITMYYVKGMSQNSLGENFRAGHGTGLIGTVSTGAFSRTLPHELGHVLLDDGSHPGDADNFMAQTSTASGKEKMTATQIATVRSSPFAV